LDAGVVELEGDLAHRVTKVLRLRAGDEIALFDGTGVEARVRIDEAGTRHVTATIVERGKSPAEPRVQVHLYQSITKGERFEWLVEKGTEIGVARFVPLIAARAVVKTPADGARIDRWRRIATEAAEQCGRGTVPAVDAPQTLAEAIETAPGVRLLPYEAAGEMAMNVQSAIDAQIDALFAEGAISIFIGPEGGYEPDEVSRAVDAGVSVVTMGARVLRSETAGIVAATLVLHAAGDLG
jgi:16S rRNA (uracil1498-N3)-methyltransferase